MFPYIQRIIIKLGINFLLNFGAEQMCSVRTYFLNGRALFVCISGARQNPWRVKCDTVRARVFCVGVRCKCTRARHTAHDNT